MPGIAKNVKIDIKHCSYESLRKPIDCFCPDLVTTFKTMVSHWPVFTEEELHVKFKGEPQPLFLQPKLKYKSKDVVWFYKKPVGKNILANVTRTLIENTPGIIIGSRRFSNKSARRTGITRMEESLVPLQKGMLTTGHRDPKSYRQYNALPKQMDDKVIQKIISGTSAMSNDGKPLLYSEVLDIEKKKYEFEQVCSYFKFLFCSILMKFSLIFLSFTLILMLLYFHVCIDGRLQGSKINIKFEGGTRMDIRFEGAEHAFSPNPIT